MTKPKIEKRHIQRNYRKGRKGKVSEIVIHTSAGGTTTLYNWFNRVEPNPSKRSSAHYGVTRDCRIEEYVSPDDTAFHVGDVNERSIGIEHLDDGKWEDADDYIECQYKLSAELVAYLCTEYNIPCDDKHISPHNRYANKACPGAFDRKRIIKEANLLIKQKIMKQPFKILSTRRKTVYVYLGDTPREETTNNPDNPQKVQVRSVYRSIIDHETGGLENHEVIGKVEDGRNVEIEKYKGEVFIHIRGKSGMLVLFKSRNLVDWVQFTSDKNINDNKK